MAAKPHYWVGIDEAGYGPNLGPLVLAAVVARGSSRPPDVWGDIAGIRRAHGIDDSALCVDDSKLVMHRRDRLRRLEEAFFAITDTIAPTRRKSGEPERLRARLLQAFGPDVFGGDELSRWSDSEPFDLEWFDSTIDDRNRRTRLACRRWRVVEARAVVIGPARFNRLLEISNNKSDVNGRTFLELIAWLRSIVPEGATVHVTSDRHGGRHFYGPLLAEAFPGKWVGKLTETPALSLYRIEDGSTTFEIGFLVKADATNGLVALASMIAKLLRERWMERFNAWFARRVPGLRPTAGYPVDAQRFLSDIRSFAEIDGLPMEDFWRRK